EPTGNSLGTAHKGFVWIDVDILGVAAHGSQPESGIDAIMNAGPFLTALKYYADSLPTDEILGKGSLHCGLIKGGVEPSTYPASCSITVEFRTVAGQTPELIVQDLKAILQDIAKTDAQFKYSRPRVTLSRPVHKLSPTHPFAAAAINAAESVI